MSKASMNVKINTADPEKTKDAVVTAAKTQDPNAKADVIRDSLGKGVEVRLDNVLKESLEIARQAVIANRGVATVGAVIPNSTVVSDIGSIQWSGTFTTPQYPGVPDQNIIIWGLDNRSFMGQLNHSGYNDGDELVTPEQMVVEFRNSSATPFIIEAGSVQVVLNGMSTNFVLNTQEDITIPVGDNIGFIIPNDFYYIDTDGNLYLAHRVLADDSEINYSYEEAIANGAI